jgi:Caspase domain
VEHSLKPLSDVKSPVQDIDSEEYNMGHPRRGIALILNHMKFEKNNDAREGTDIDCKSLTDMLTNLGFEVRVHNDLTDVEVLTALKKCS